VAWDVSANCLRVCIQPFPTLPLSLSSFSVVTHLFPSPISSRPSFMPQVTMQVSMKDLGLSEREQKRLRCLVCMLVLSSLPPSLSLFCSFVITSRYFRTCAHPSVLPSSPYSSSQVGSRYNPGRRDVTLVSNRFMNRDHNKQYLIYLLENLVSEAQGKGNANASV